MTIIDIVNEPAGNDYKSLVASAAKLSTMALLVVRQEIGLTEHAERILRDLDRFLIRRAWGQRWPGTELFDGRAEIFTYRLSDKCVDLLTSTVTGLYSWQQPEAPEDLCLLREDGSPVLATIAHERDAYLELSPQEVSRLLEIAPALRRLLVL